MNEYYVIGSSLEGPSKFISSHSTLTAAKKKAREVTEQYEGVWIEKFVDGIAQKWEQWCNE